MQVIGHRGCSDRFPENSLAAIRGCGAHVDMVEIDVQRCSTGEIVVFHDDELDRLTESTGPVARTPFEELSGLRIAGSEETVPTLEAALAALPDATGLNVELKHPGMAGDVEPLLRKLDRDVIVSSFDEAALAEVSDRIPTAYLFADSVAEGLATATELGCEYVHPQYRLVDETLIERARDRGLAVNAWTVPTRAAVSRLRNAGVDGVIVDDWEIV